MSLNILLRTDYKRLPRILALCVNKRTVFEEYFIPSTWSDVAYPERTIVIDDRTTGIAFADFQHFGGAKHCISEVADLMDRQ